MKLAQGRAEQQRDAAQLAASQLAERAAQCEALQEQLSSQAGGLQHSRDGQRADRAELARVLAEVQDESSALRHQASSCTAQFCPADFCKDGCLFCQQSKRGPCPVHRHVMHAQVQTSQQELTETRAQLEVQEKGRMSTEAAAAALELDRRHREKVCALGILPG